VYTGLVRRQWPIPGSCEQGNENSSNINSGHFIKAFSLMPVLHGVG